MMDLALIVAAALVSFCGAVIYLERIVPNDRV